MDIYLHERDFLPDKVPLNFPFASGPKCPTLSVFPCLNFCRRRRIEFFKLSIVEHTASETPRFCVDYWALNAITKRDNYPSPRIDELLDRLAGAKFFTLWIWPVGTGRFGLRKRTSRRRPSRLVTVLSSFLWCPSASQMHRVPFSGWWTKSLVPLLSWFYILWSTCILSFMVKVKSTISFRLLSRWNSNYLDHFTYWIQDKHYVCN